MPKFFCLLASICVLVSSQAYAASDQEIGTPLHQALWKVAAQDYLREHPELFAPLAAAYLGVGSNSTNVGASATARVIPNFDPVAAALLRLRTLPSNASLENKQAILTASDASLSTIADALYSSIVLKNTSDRAKRLRKVVAANPGGLVSPKSTLRELLSKMSAAEPMNRISTAFNHLNDEQANSVIHDSGKLTAFLIAATGGTEPLRNLVNASLDNASTQVSASVQTQAQTPHTAITTNADQSLKSAQSVKNGVVAVVSLIDPQAAKDIDGFATPALSGWSAIQDLSINGFSAAASGNLVSAAVGLVKFFGDIPDSNAIALQQIQRQLKAISEQLKVIDKKLDVIDGKLDIVISKLDYAVSNQNVNTQRVLAELKQIEDQVATSQTLTWIAIQSISSHDVNRTFATCKFEFENHISKDVATEFTPANIEYQRCLGTFFNEALADARAPGSFSTDIAFNRGDLLRLISKKLLPEHALGLLPYLVASAVADPVVATVAPDTTTGVPPFDPETWADGVRLYLQLRYWVPEVPDDAAALAALSQAGQAFKTSYSSVVARDLPKKAVSRYIALETSLDQFLVQTVQPLFDQAQLAKGLDLTGKTRPAVFSGIDVFAPTDSFQSRIFGITLQLGLAQEIDSVRGDGSWMVTPRHRARSISTTMGVSLSTQRVSWPTAQRSSAQNHFASAGMHRLCLRN